LEIGAKVQFRKRVPCTGYEGKACTGAVHFVPETNVPEIEPCKGCKGLERVEDKRSHTGKVIAKRGCFYTLECDREKCPGCKTPGIIAKNVDPHSYVTVDAISVGSVISF